MYTTNKNHCTNNSTTSGLSSPGDLAARSSVGPRKCHHVQFPLLVILYPDWQIHHHYVTGDGSKSCTFQEHDGTIIFGGGSSPPSQDQSGMVSRQLLYTWNIYGGERVSERGGKGGKKEEVKGERKGERKEGSMGSTEQSKRESSE